MRLKNVIILDDAVAAVAWTYKNIGKYGGSHRKIFVAGHKDVTLYEMQGYDHGAMPQPANYILKQHIKRLTENKTNQK